VPLTEFCGVPVEVPGAPEVEPLEPVLPPELPDEPPLEPPPPCPSASETGVSRIAVTNTSVFDRMIFLLLKATHDVVARSHRSVLRSQGPRKSRSSHKNWAYHEPFIGT
jgi:hypothetical protein